MMMEEHGRLTLPPVCRETRCNLVQVASVTSRKLRKRGTFLSRSILKSSVWTYEVKKA